MFGCVQSDRRCQLVAFCWRLFPWIVCPVPQIEFVTAAETSPGPGSYVENAHPDTQRLHPLEGG